MMGTIRGHWTSSAVELSMKPTEAQKDLMHFDLGLKLISLWKLVLVSERLTTVPFAFSVSCSVW